MHSRTVEHLVRCLIYGVVSLGAMLIVAASLFGPFWWGGASLIPVILGGAALIALAAPCYGIVHSLLGLAQKAIGRSAPDTGALITVAALYGAALIPLALSYGHRIARVVPLESHFAIWAVLTLSAAAISGAIVSSAIVSMSILLPGAIASRWSERGKRAAQRAR